MMLRLDYATINFDAGLMSVPQLEEVLAGGVPFGWRRHGLSDNAPMSSPLGVVYQANSGWCARPHKLQVSGVGTEKFMYTLPLLRSSVGADHCHFSRLDFAFDVKMRKSEWRDFLARVFSASLNSDRERKKFALTGTGEAMTVYIGVRKGSKYFRIYNKSLEDGEYKLEDERGDYVAIDTDHYIIRYEVELKRTVHIRSGVRDVFDPSPLFDAYYSDDVSREKELVDTIKGLWLSFGDDILLPEGFADAELSLRYSKTKNFVQKREQLEGRNFDPVLYTKSQVHDAPHAFDHTINWIVDKLGKYIPWIVAENDLFQRCEDACRRDFGFVPEFFVESRITWDGDFEELPDGTETPFLPWDYDDTCEFRQETWDSLDFS